MKSLAVLAFAFLVADVPQDDYSPASPQKEHEWLQQLVGEWDVESRADLGPGVDPMVLSGSESMRSLGGLWVVGEGQATVAGKPFTSMMTLGYDPVQKVFVGTWIDTMQTHMWTYRGSLDESGKVLTLDTEGPAFDDPSKMAHYRDAIEVRDANTKFLVSSMKNAEGEWTPFQKSTFTRKASKGKER